MSEEIKRAEFDELVGPLVGMPVSRPWRGNGTALFLDLGEIRPAEDTGYRWGQACVQLEWDWRIESDEKAPGVGGGLISFLNPGWSPDKIRRNLMLYENRFATKLQGPNYDK